MHIYYHLKYTRMSQAVDVRDMYEEELAQNTKIAKGCEGESHGKSYI